MAKFIFVELLGEGTEMAINVEHIFTVIDKPDYRIIVTDMYDSPNKRKTYKVRNSYNDLITSLK